MGKLLFFDELTSTRRLGGRKSRERRLAAGGAVVLLIVSPEALGAVNRVYGYDAGDEILSMLTRRLFAAAPKDAVLARLAGAKFALVVPVGAPEAALAAADAIYDKLAGGSGGAPEGGLAAEPRIGVAWAEGGARPTDMIAAALAALDRARRMGTLIEIDGIDARGAGGGDLVEARVALHAAAKGLASIALQPVVSSEGEARVMFREALIRVPGPGGAPLAAGRFMPALERLGMTEEMDLAALRLAFEALARDPGLRVSVNLSGASIARRRWPDALSALARQAPRCAERLIVEVTEEATLADSAAAAGLFAAIRAHGAALALDDFGAGRTSFSHLRDFRFDMVKIDGGFVRGIDQSADNRMLVSALVAIARQFEMMVIAEFVETEAEARALRALGVDGFQGFLFGRPENWRSAGANVSVQDLPDSLLSWDCISAS